MVEFAIYEIVLFIFLLIYLGVMLVLSILFLRKYFEFKLIEFFHLGVFILIFAITITLQWIISFIVLALMELTIDPTLLYAVQGGSTVALIFWLLGLDKILLSGKTYRKVFLFVLIVAVVVVALIYYIALFIDYTLIGTLDPKGWTPLTWTPLASICFSAWYLIFFITFLLFTIQAITSNEKTTQIKGKILLIASILIGISIISIFFLGFFDGVVYWIFTFTFVHVFRIAAFITFYIGFTLPNFIKKILLKDK
ncbi:MAG: hypothetical protein GF311_11215 [Candidatus Lokiarchaeota archaeon]|nr:hypothetical protein [Candidatus Lokiarchaeota archaeon]